MNQIFSLKGNDLENLKNKITSEQQHFNFLTDCNQWNYLENVRILEELENYNRIKYAAYRTAMKLRHIQKMFKLHWIRISLIASIYENLGVYSQKQVLNYKQLQKLLCCIYSKIEGTLTNTETAELYSKVLFNFLQNIFDVERKGNIELSSVTVFLSMLCSSQLIEKYKYIFNKFSGSNGFLSKKNLYIILYNIAKIPEILGEKLNFGTQLVLASVESCCKWNSSINWISESGFLDWMKQEPQTLVWISTHFRLSTAENVEHFVKCEVCKIYPIIGLRYQCTYCFNYNQCQNCFFYGYVNKNHKLKHSLQEYCQPLSSWKITKALLKSIQNKLNIFQHSTSKWNYLMIDSHMAITKKREFINTEDKSYVLNVSKLFQRNSVEFSNNISDIEMLNNVYIKSRYLKEFQNIVSWLENENKYIGLEIERLHAYEEIFNGNNSLEENNNRELLKRKEILEDHSHRLEVQIHKFKKLLQNINEEQADEEEENKKNKHMYETPMKNHLLKLESTPIPNQIKKNSSDNLNTFKKIHNELEELESITKELEQSVKTIPDLKNLQLKENSIKNCDSELSYKHSDLVNTKKGFSPEDACQYLFNDLTAIQMLSSQSSSQSSNVPVNEPDQSIEAEFQKIIWQLENILNYNSVSNSSDTTANFRKKILNMLNEVEDVIEEFPIIEETKM